MSDNKKDNLSSRRKTIADAGKIPSEDRGQKVDLGRQDKRKASPITIPIEKYAGYMSPAQIKTYKEYQRSQFPDLFSIKGLENDKGSEVPFLSLTKATRLLADLLEADLTRREKEVAEKVLN